VPWLAVEYAFSGGDPEWIGPGTYSFSARVVAPATGAATGWSPDTDVKMKCCHSAVGISTFQYRTPYSVGGTPMVWRVHDTSGKRHVLVDGSKLHLFRSPPLANAASFAYTFKGAGSYPVVDQVAGVDQTVEIKPGLSAQFVSVGEPVTVTAAVSPPAISHRVWQMQIKAPGDTALRLWHVGRIGVFTPGRTGQFLFRARLWDWKIHAGIPWSPSIPVVVSPA
ncbi:MAG: hypothetical protein ACHQNA_13905, partial [Acidimicrobiales bacterium]